MARDVVELTPETAARLQRLLRASARGQPKHRARIDYPVPAQRTIFYNDSGETVPGYACMAVTGIDFVDTRPIVKISKPSTTFRRHYVINGPRAVEYQAYGTAQDTGQPVRVLYDDAHTPAVGEGWGPQAGSWKVAQHYPETALVIGQHSDEESLMAKWHTIDRWLGKAASGIAKGASGPCTPYQGVMGSEATAGFSDVTAYNRFGAVDGGSWVWVNNASGGNWYITAAECPA